MADRPESRLLRALLDALPPDGSAAGNAKLRYSLAAKLEREVSEDEYAEVRDALVEGGWAIRGKGRGGSLCRAVPASEVPRQVFFREPIRRQEFHSSLPGSVPAPRATPGPDACRRARSPRCGFG